MATARSSAWPISTPTFYRSIAPSGCARVSECSRIGQRGCPNFTHYAFPFGHRADYVTVNAQSPKQAIAETAQPLAVFKHERQTVVWHPPQLLRPRQY